MCYWLVGSRKKGILKGVIKAPDGKYEVDVYLIDENDNFVYQGSTSKLGKSDIGKKLTKDELFVLGI